ncbi:SGNH/GDSL hydrolase family protein [Nocardioides aquiterrae]|uniref:SGNH hydrolase-type esterase domain-containing protein n=1 Tax=Nocardioides aquiterrae TaxID=203799 RepID=A0ABP4F4M3_9ACTN
MSSRVGGVLVALLAVLVVVATAAMWVDFRHEVDRTASRIAREPALSDPPSPTASPSERAGVRSVWIGDGYTARSCDAATALGWECAVDAQQGTGFLSDGTAFDPDNRVLGGRLDDLPAQEPDVVVVDAGRNDLGVYATPAILDAIEVYLGRLRERYPDAVLVQIVPWTRADPDPDPAVAREIARLMRKYDGHALDPAGQILDGTTLADAIRALDLPVPVEKG